MEEHDLPATFDPTKAFNYLKQAYFPNNPRRWRVKKFFWIWKNRIKMIFLKRGECGDYWVLDLKGRKTRWFYRVENSLLKSSRNYTTFLMMARDQLKERIEKEISKPPGKTITFPYFAPIGKDNEKKHH